MQKEYEKALEMERERERRQWEENLQYQEELEKQLRDQEKAKQEQYEEFLKEKLMIDEIVRKIYAEDQKYITFPVLSCLDFVCYISLNYLIFLVLKISDGVTLFIMMIVFDSL